MLKPDGFYGYIGTTEGYITINADTSKDGLQNFTFQYADKDGRPF